MSDIPATPEVVDFVTNVLKATRAGTIDWQATRMTDHLTKVNRLLQNQADRGVSDPRTTGGG
jgi:hypothetical protein